MTKSVPKAPQSYCCCGAQGKRCGTRLTKVEADLHIPESSDNVVDSASCSVTGFSSQKSSVGEIPFRLQASGTGIKNA